MNLIIICEYCNSSGVWQHVDDIWCRNFGIYQFLHGACVFQDHLPGHRHWSVSRPHPTAYSSLYDCSDH